MYYLLVNNFVRGSSDPCSLAYVSALGAAHATPQYTVSGKKRPQYSRHNFDKFRHSYVIFYTRGVARGGDMGECPPVRD